MGPMRISDRIIQATKRLSINTLVCDGLDLSESYLRELKVLVCSRNWSRIELNRCKGIGSLFHESSNVGEESNGISVGYLFLRFLPESQHGYNGDRDGNFFVNLFILWKVQRLFIWMDFTPSWTREFCANPSSDDKNSICTSFHSELEELTIGDGCTWHLQANGNNETVDATENEIIMDCWKYLCRHLAVVHPKLKALLVMCKAGDDDLAFLIRHTAGPHCLLPALETLRFGKRCFCDQNSLAALTQAFSATIVTEIDDSASKEEEYSSFSKRIKELSICRGKPLPSIWKPLPSGSLGLMDEIHRQQLGLLDFCAALGTATALQCLVVSDYVFDAKELGRLFESLVRSGGKIERIWLLQCNVTSPNDYEELKGYLLRNELQRLKNLFLPEEAAKVLGEALEKNTSVEFINYSRGGSPTLRYYLDLNRGGRRIINGGASESPNVAPSLYPILLDRASVLGKKERYLGGDKRKYDVIYSLLRNRIALEQK